MSAPFQLLPPLAPDEMAELRASIEQHGIQVPILVDEHGAIIDGHHRKQIADEFAVECPTQIRDGLSDEQKRTLARTLNTARRHLTREQIRALIAGQLRDTPERSDTSIAKDMGVHPTTVGTVRRKLEDDGEVSKLETTIGANGKEQSRKRKPDPVPQKTAPAAESKPAPEPENDELPDDEEAAHQINAVFEVALKQLPAELKPPFMAAANRVHRALTRWCKRMARVYAEVMIEKETRGLKDQILRYRFMEVEWRRAIDESRQARQPVEQFWTLEEYRKIRSALHPDREPSKGKLDEAYKLFAKVDKAFEKVKRREDGIAKAAATRAAKKAAASPASKAAP